MLTQTCRIVCEEIESEGTQKVTPFEIRYSNAIASSIPESLHWRPVDIERFQLIANETAKVGQPVNRADALYWVEVIKARALGPGEAIGWVKVH